MIKNLSSNCDKIKLHGYKINIYDDKVEIYIKKNVVPDEFRPKANMLIRYLIDEGFVADKPFRIEVLRIP